MYCGDGAGVLLEEAVSAGDLTGRSGYTRYRFWGLLAVLDAGYLLLAAGCVAMGCCMGRGRSDMRPVPNAKCFPTSGCV